MTNSKFEESKSDEKEEQKEAEYSSAKDNLYMIDLHSTINSKKRNSNNYVLTENDDEKIQSELLKSLRATVLPEQNTGRRKSYL